MKKGILFLWVLIGLTGCREELKPRPPVYHTYRHDFSRSIMFNRVLYNMEQKLFDSIMKTDTLHRYRSTGIGMWWYHVKENPADSIHPAKGDWVEVTYMLQYLNGDTIYSFQDMGIKKYLTDKEEYFLGFREAVKLLKEGEEGVFFIPSYAGYGLLGDADRIPGNTPLIMKLKILKINKNQNKNEKNQ